MEVDSYDNYEIARTIRALKNNNSIEFFARTASYDKYEAETKKEEQLAMADPRNGLEIECIFLMQDEREESEPPDSGDECSPPPEMNPRQCQYCFKTLSSKSKLNRHLKIHTEKRYFDCNICLQVFRTQKIFDEHLKEHGDNTVESILEPEIILSDCSDEEEVSTSCILEPEVIVGEDNSDDDSKPFEFDDDDEISPPLSNTVVAPIASIPIATNADLLANEPKQNQNPKARRYQCKLCPKAFRYSSKLARHQTVHTGEKPFQCEICQKCFTSKYSLKFHLQLHAKKGKYICKVCGKAFFNDHVLQRHQAVHSKGTKYKCHDCGRTYKWKNRFVEHKNSNCKYTPKTKRPQLY